MVSREPTNSTNAILKYRQICISGVFSATIRSALVKSAQISSAAAKNFFFTDANTSGGYNFSTSIKIRLSASKDENGNVIPSNVNKEGLSDKVKNIVEWDVRTEYLYTVGTVSYYFLTGLNPRFEDIDNTAGRIYYILSYDSAGDGSVQMYSLGSPEDVKTADGEKETAVSKDYFLEKYLSGSKHDDDSFLVKTGPNSGSNSEQPAYYSYMAQQGADMIFTFANFANTG